MDSSGIAFDAFNPLSAGVGSWITKQNRQTTALKKEKVFRIFTDTVSGSSTQRLGLDGALHIAAYTLTDGKSYYNQNPTDSPSNWASENEKLETPTGTMSRDFTRCPRVDSNHRHRL